MTGPDIHREVLDNLEDGVPAVGAREVEIGPTTRSSVEIRAGLEAGETVLLPGS